MKLVPLSDLFNIGYGNSFDLVALETLKPYEPARVNYVSRTRENNGVSAYVKRKSEVAPFPPGLITVAGSGNSVLESFIQNRPFYTGYHVFVLEPVGNMTELEKLFYCYCLKQNQYKYSFGRQANRTLNGILVPAKMPTSFSKISVESLNTTNSENLIKKGFSLKFDSWEHFSLEDLFVIHKGKRLTKADRGVGGTYFIGSSDSNNGITAFVGHGPVFEGNTITVNYNGSVGEAFYQPHPFWASDDVNVLYPRFEMNKYIGLFITTVIRLEKFRFNYGRKWEIQKCVCNKILLPSKKGKPDFEYMEKYIMTLPFSSSI
ncbi:MAG: restriction endonuclease subunit S [Flavobacteriales bacterium]|nr:restriction endonuclease subunit S [Flavobacteriales bacterium]